MKPFVKWAGGKRQILPEIIELVDILEDGNKNYTFIEPFVGGGAVFLYHAHQSTIINDLNEELINAYNVIKNFPNELMNKLEETKVLFMKNKEEVYYGIRELDRDKEEYAKLTEIEKANRTIFLNKTCFNGLYRVNSMGEFNTPMGRYKNPMMYERNNIIELSNYFNNNRIEILNTDYKNAIELSENNDIIYVDPPYDYGNEDGFTGYQKEGFTFEDFIELKTTLDKALQRGAKVIISNNATKRVIKLFEKDPHYQVIYNLNIIRTRRNINSDGEKRNTGKEVLIMGAPVTFPQANSIEKLARLIRMKDLSILKNTEKMKIYLNVTTFRQVHYYLTALSYLKLIDNKKGLTNKGKELRTLNSAIYKDALARYIITFPVFKEIYYRETSENRKLDKLEIVNYIEKAMPNYSMSTYLRRVSTVRKWIDWANLHIKENKFDI